MRSLAQQHLNQHQTAAAPAALDAPSPCGTHPQLLMRCAYLQVELIKLKAIRSREARNQRKSELLRSLTDYLNEVLASGQAGHDPVLVRCCIWAMDCQQFERCLQLAEYAIQHQMPAPPEFTRTVPEILMEELAYQALYAEQPQDYCEPLLRLDELTTQEDVQDAIRGKFYKALGLAQPANKPQAALSLFQQAARYGSSVKTNLNKLKREIESYE